MLVWTGGETTMQEQHRSRRSLVNNNHNVILWGVGDPDARDFIWRRVRPCVQPLEALDFTIYDYRSIQ